MAPLHVDHHRQDCLVRKQLLTVCLSCQTSYNVLSHTYVIIWRLGRVVFMTREGVKGGGSWCWKVQYCKRDSLQIFVTHVRPHVQRWSFANVKLLRFFDVLIALGVVVALHYVTKTSLSIFLSIFCISGGCYERVTCKQINMHYLFRLSGNFSPFISCKIPPKSMIF